MIIGRSALRVRSSNRSTDLLVERNARNNRPNGRIFGRECGPCGAGPRLLEMSALIKSLPQRKRRRFSEKLADLVRR